ncbi:TPM domain-containing protein [Amnibacterium endophyticum]|uniref:TPM domain-containing protein n=1 Tax=Amnibacterium endophyticum TaxID=2109337 RepID=A0ABW4LFC0_9MICO
MSAADSIRSTGGNMRRRRLVAGLALGAALALAGAPAAFAEPPVDLGSQQLVDASDVLTPDEETQVRDALQSYDTATGNDLRVVFVDTFTDPSDRRGWSETTAEQGSFSDPGLVLAVATGARQYGFATAADFPVDDSAVQQVASSDLEPAFGRGDWAGGVEAFATGLQDAQQNGAGSGGGTSGGGTSDGGATGTASSGSGVGASIVIGLLVLAAAVVIVLLVLRRRSRQQEQRSEVAAGPPPVDQEELDRRASRALIALDDDLTTSEQELGFATAEFGDDATGVFAQALTRAKATSREAFGIRQQLDDDDPETPEQRRAMTERIIALCEQAEGVLQEQKTSFDELRRLEQQLPQLVPAARQQHDALTARAAEAERALEGIERRFGEPAVRGAADDLQQARDLLDLSAQALGDAERDGAAGGEATVAVRSAQQANSQAGVLLDGIVSAPGEFMAARRRLDDAVADTQQDLVEAERAPQPTPELTEAIAGARKAIGEVELQAPHAGLATMEEADARLERALAPVRDAARRRQRAVETLPRVIDAADDAVRAARRYIENRRGGVGSTARTRLAEAARQLDVARDRQHDDPVAALEAAQRAQSLANQARDQAEQDVNRWHDDDWGGGGWGGRRRSSGGDVLAGAVIAGVLGGILGGGGRGGGGWSAGGGYGSGGGFGGGGGGWGGGGGGFGGGGGGGFGGGGGGGGSF